MYTCITFIINIYIYYFDNFLRRAMLFLYVPFILEKLVLKNLKVLHIYINCFH